MIRHFPAAVVAAVVLAMTTPAVVSAQSAENVGVVVNDNSLDSQRIADYYVRARNIPTSNVLHIRTSVDDEIGRDAYVRTIEQPLGLAIRRRGLQDRLLYLVLTKGVPLRIAGTGGPTGTVGSVDSELTLLYRRLVGTPVAANGRVDNPYYLGDRGIATARPFSHRSHDIYLVTRLDAFTVEEALGLIDRAQAPKQDGVVVLDQRGNRASGDQWMERAASRLAAAGYGSRVVLESTPEPARSEKAVLGYYSWGAADPENRVRSVSMGFTPGAIAAHVASFDARTFHEPPAEWRPTFSTKRADGFAGTADALIGDVIREGVTGVAGQVAEAYASGAVRPEILFPAYLAGFNLAEAFYLAVPTLSWQTVVIGDPLCAPFGRTPLTRDELEDPLDVTTENPGLFSKRRLAVVLAGNRDAPEDAGMALMRAQAFLDREDRVGTKRALEEVVTLAPTLVQPLADLADLDEQAGDFDAAIVRYRRILDLQPDHVVALNNLAYSLAVRRNAPAEALPYAERALAVAPTSPSVADTFAWVHHLNGDGEVAAKVYDRLVPLAMRDPEVRFHAAVVYASIGDTARSRIEFEEALRLNSSLANSEVARDLSKRLGMPPVR